MVMKLFTSLLGLQKRDMEDPALAKCRDTCLQPKRTVIDLTREVDQSSTKSDALPDVQQCSQPMAFFGDKMIHDSYLSSTAKIDASLIAKETAEWEVAHQKSRDDYRAKRAAGEGSQRRRRPREGRDEYRKRKQRYRAAVRG